jgi:hypothetical protein
MTLTRPLHRPPSLATPIFAMLAAVRRRARWLACLESLAWLALAAVATFWLSLAADRALEPPAWIRVAVVVAAVAALGWILRRLVDRLTAPLPDAALALAVERTHPQFGDTLSTAIGLADPTATAAAGIDPDLVARTTAAAAGLVGAVRPAALFRHGRIATLVACAAVAAGSIPLLAAVRPAVVGHWARRVLRLDDTPWPRRVALVAEGFESGTRVVARGSDIALVVRARSTAALPDLVELRTRPVGSRAAWRIARMGSRGAVADGTATFEHKLTAVEADVEVEVRGGDARLTGLVLRTVEPPAVERLEIEYEPPAYLGAGWRPTPPTRTVRVPRGAHVRLRVTATKPLAEAAIVAEAAGGERTLAALGVAAASGTNRALAAEIDALDADLAVAIRLRDTAGVAAREPARVGLAVIPDDGPAVALRLRGISTAVTPRASLPLEGTIVDDHGLAAAAVLVAGTGTNAPATARLAIARVHGGETRVEFTAASPLVAALEPLGIAAGSRVTVQVEARDACGLAGGPNVGKGDAWTLDVVAPEALQSLLDAREMLLRRRFEAVLADLTQARNRLAAVTDAAATDGQRLGDAAARAAGETADIAAAFRLVQLEFANNGMLTPEIDARLVGEIADPLATLAATDLADLERRGRADGAAEGKPDTPALVAAADRTLARMQAVLDKMLELESFNEVVDRLRSVITAQEQLRRDTLERQKRRGREALESP